MRPVIGITCNFSSQEKLISLSRQYVRAIEAAGGLPVLAGPLAQESVGELAKHLDGLMLSGGGDIDPFFFGEEPQPDLGEIEPERDVFELALTGLMLAEKRPILSICRGMQVLNVAMGGTLCQDLKTLDSEFLKHFQRAPRQAVTHHIEIEENSLLAKLMGTRRLRVNSFHHQAVAVLAPGLKVSARAPDGVIEAMEDNNGLVLGVQFHPEWLWEEDGRFVSIFSWLVKAAADGK